MMLMQDQRAEAINLAQEAQLRQSARQQPSTSKTVSVTNDSETKTVSITSIAIAASFVLVGGNDLGNSIPTGKMCTVSTNAAEIWEVASDKFRGRRL
jgi:hypothetical protein